MSIVRNIFIAALLIFLFYFMPTRQLLHLIIGMGKIDPNDPRNARLSLPDNNRKDELQVSAGRENQLLGSIGHCIEKWRGVEEDLKQKNRIVDATLQNMDEGIVMLIVSRLWLLTIFGFLSFVVFQIISFHEGHRGSNFPATMLKLVNIGRGKLKI